MFFNIMRYLPARLQKRPSLHVPVGMFCVEFTELIPWLKTKSGLEFNEAPYAFIYEHHGEYHHYTGPAITQYYHLEGLINWMLSINRRRPTRTVSQER